MNSVPSETKPQTRIAMEAVGLAVGALALVGVFKDCVDLLSYIDTARSLGRDYEVCQTKLEVEKTLFLQWADRVGLLQVRCDERLKNSRTSEAIARILASIRILFSESKTLQGRYGLQTVDDGEETSIDRGFSGPRMTDFVNQFEALRVRIYNKQEEISRTRKARRVIRDKLKFEGLIQELSYFNSKLNEIMPDTRGFLPRMTAEDIEAFKGLGNLRLVSEASAGRQALVSELADVEIGRILEQRVLRRLWFRTMDDRKDDLKPAHLQTFRWALERPQDCGAKWDDLGEWLRAGSGVYWINGKAGSGKSTLMKHVYGDPKTAMLLKEWSGDRKHTTACFFFWALGSSEQRSQEGLMRALLFHVLEADPSLIPELLPKLWREVQGVEEEDSRAPTIPEMHHAFMNLGSSWKEEKSFCFFIDGLDKFSGSYFDGIEFINSLLQRTSIKVLVSSRPIPECVEAFGKQPKLRLQDLTRG
ncbi:NACHT domain-containing protein, partial [Candidatus Bathyarchaeota archaeon]|nr:NACHT domain-containing protein [Candidatus Bathyarchaeota archaeon]